MTLLLGNMQQRSSH